MNQYLSRPDVKKKEKTELLTWIKEENTPYCNDRYVFDESDHLPDFIGAICVDRKYHEEQWRLRQSCEQ